jgi:hypothetical protein
MGRNLQQEQEMVGDIQGRAIQAKPASHGLMHYRPWQVLGVQATGMDIAYCTQVLGVQATGMDIAIRIQQWILHIATFALLLENSNTASTNIQQMTRKYTHSTLLPSSTRNCKTSATRIHKRTKYHRTRKHTHLSFPSSSPSSARNCMTCEAKPPMAPSSMEIITGCSTAHWRMRSVSRGLQNLQKPEVTFVSTCGGATPNQLESVNYTTTEVTPAIKLKLCCHAHPGMQRQTSR